MTVASISIFMTSSADIPVCDFKAGASVAGWALKVALKCSSRGGGCVEGVVMVTVRC